MSVIPFAVVIETLCLRLNNWENILIIWIELT